MTPKNLRIIWILVGWILMGMGITESGQSGSVWAGPPPEAEAEVVPNRPPDSLKVVTTVGGSQADAKGFYKTPQGRMTLRDAYLAALRVSETVNVQKELTIQTDEGLSQANGALFPTISGAYTFLNQPSPNSSTGTAIYPSSQSTAKVTADQPLFRGLRDFAALRQRKYLIGAQFNTYLAAARQLFYDTSTAYYNVLAYEADERNYKIEIDVNLKRLKELEGFFKIGRSQLTDVLTFKSNIASLEAQLAATQGQVEIAKEVLAFLTRWNRNTPLEDEEASLFEPGDIEQYLAKVDDRPEVKSALENVKANDEGVPIAFGQHFPSLDLIGDYYFARPGVLSDVNWDVQLALTVPIFQGGVIQSQVRQARSVARQYEQLLSQARETAVQEVRTFYDAVFSDSRQLFKLKELVVVSKLNADTEVKYYRNGLVTNLDVLTAITTYQDAQRQKDHQDYTVKLDTVKLKAATGQRPEIVVTRPKQ